MARQGSVPAPPPLDINDVLNIDGLVSDERPAEVTHGAPPPAQCGPIAPNDALPATTSLNYAIHAIPMPTSLPSSHSAASGTASSSSASLFDGYHATAAAAVAIHSNSHTAANQPNFTLPSTSTAPSPAANAVSLEALLALINAQPGVNGAALPLVAGRSDNTMLAGTVANPPYPFSMQFLPGAPLPGSPGTAFPRNGSPAAASTPSPAASAVSSDAYVAASAQLTASGAGSQLSLFTSLPPQTPVLPVGANGLASPLYQLMQALEQAQAIVTQLATGGNASPIPATPPPPRALKDALVTSATLKADATLADARNAAAPFVCGKSSWDAWTVTMQDSPASKPSSMCELYLHVLLAGAENQLLEPAPDAVVRMHVKIEIQSLKRPDMPMETVFDGWHAFTARPMVELHVRFTRVLAKPKNQRENRLKITITPVGGESMVVAGLPSTITFQSRRTGDRKTKPAADESSTPTSSSSSSAPAPPTPSPRGQATKKRSVGQRDAASTDGLSAISDDQVEDVRRMIANGGAVAEIGKILGGCAVPYDVRRDLLETVLRVHLVTNPPAQPGPWSAAEFDLVVTWLSDAPGKSVWTDHMLVHDVAQRCFDRDQLRAMFRPLLSTTSSTATPASPTATALRLALVTPNKDGRTPAHVAAYCVNVEFLVLVGQVYPMALAQLNAMTRTSFLHSLAGRDGAADALQRLRDELPPEIMDKAVRAINTDGCTPLAMAEHKAKVKKRDEAWRTVEMLSEMVAAMQVA
ncbi:hypothetical protein AMAG_15118 [Allomyces macrogynus ATCC 38327]|uniref:Uncharacterized protein n=1 Tax=Allomyces macrogynus (strain ATCC 38327) TaxID=578462 RepID=A0A0L0T6H0_ALLM3|nr:hypothetical protein AMAG_15118 [Allomyces macrogynus ATCC 38327]|eukprot:KNE70144.1 hypothetical protein AMAG_15118 [Allomyces macrogynus ATCC 38327]